MALAKSQRSLKAWGKQKWRTKSGKKSSETGERYLPEKAIKALSSAEYAATPALVIPAPFSVGRKNFFVFGGITSPPLAKCNLILNLPYPCFFFLQMFLRL